MSDMSDDKSNELVQIIGEHITSLVYATHSKGFRDYNFKTGKGAECWVETEDGQRYRFWVNLVVVPEDQDFNIKIEDQ